MARNPNAKKSNKTAAPAPSRTLAAVVRSTPETPPPISATSPLRPLVVDDRLLVIAFAVLLTGGALWTVREVMIPLLFVVIVTFMGAPFVEWLEKRNVPRTVGAGCFLLAVVGAGAALVALVVPALVADIAKLVEKLPALLAAGAALIETRTGMVVPTSITELSGEASRELREQLSPFAAKGGALVGAGALGIARGAASAAGFVGKALLVPIISYFLLAELPEVKRFVRDIAPVRARTVGARYIPLVDNALSGLVRGQLTVAALMAVLYIIGLGISGVPLALGIGILAGVAYLIPFASATTALVLSIAFTLLELGAGATGPIVGAVITCVLVQVLEGYVLTPRIVGEKAGLSPLAALLAVLLGGSAAGFLGVLFALPVGAVVALVLREEVLERRATAPRALE